MRTRSSFLVAASLSAILFVAGCDSAEERAEGHYEKAMELIDAGDVDRALVELRNVFQLNAQHTEARRLYAQTMLDMGRTRDAFGNFTLVSERLPQDLDSRLKLARLAVELLDWEAFERHATRAQEIASDDPETQAIWAIKQFRDAAVAEDVPAREAAAEEIRRMSESRPDDLLLRRILIENEIMAQRYSSALEEVEAALEVAEERRDLLRARLALLLQLGEEDAVEEQLVQLVESDPSDEEMREALIRWYLSRGDMDEADVILRREAYAEDATTDERIRYVAYVQQIRGSDAAREEINDLLELGQDTEVLRSLRAGLDFDEGRREEAIAELQSIIDGAEPSDVLRDVKVSLARLQTQMGNAVEARRLVEEVLAEDPTNVAGLKMLAEWLIQEDTPDEAIVTLRTALDQEPRDPEIMTLMAAAYLRSGSQELAGEMFSLAVDASNNAPEESIRYARFLAEDEKYGVAEPILINALRLAPGNFAILAELGRVYLAMEDWPRLEQVEATLRRLEQPQATAAANGLRVERLQRQERTDEAVALLETIIQEEGANDRAALEIVRAHLRNNDLEAAENFIDSVLSENPGDAQMKFLRAAVLAATDRADQAEAIYRELLAENPESEAVWRTLYVLLNREGRFEEGRAALGDALEALPQSPNLQWAMAGELEREGDIEGAIAIYETLYEQNSNSAVIANNLASLITTYREDEESLDRAWAIARRLRGAERPEFQDTYGWIALRRGDAEEAIEHLEPAASALSTDPLVQFHLGMAYARADRTEEALSQLRKAIELAGPADSRPQFDTAREEIQRLEEVLVEKPTE